MHLAIDFDSTIALSDWPEIAGVVPGAIDALRELHDRGHHILIWSARNNHIKNSPADRARGLQAMKEFLKQNDIPYDDIDYGKKGKPIADCYIDDKALGAPTRIYKGRRVIDWTAALNMVRLLAVKSRLCR